MYNKDSKKARFQWIKPIVKITILISERKIAIIQIILAIKNKAMQRS